MASSSAFRFLVPSCLSRTLPGPPASSYTYPTPLPWTAILRLQERSCVSVKELADCEVAGEGHCGPLEADWETLDSLENLGQVFLRHLPVEQPL